MCLSICLSLGFDELLFNIEQLTTYGMACSEDAIFGAFKLEMKFAVIPTRSESKIESGTAFVTKVKVGQRDILEAAALMDLLYNIVNDYPDTLVVYCVLFIVNFVH